MGGDILGKIGREGFPEEMTFVQELQQRHSKHRSPRTGACIPDVFKKQQESQCG